MTQKLSLRIIVTGCVLSALMTMSAVYLALRMNAFYWASILTSLSAVGILRLIARLSGKVVTVHEVNLTQTMGSTGGIAAAGICFTIPALHFMMPGWRDMFLNQPVIWSLKIGGLTLLGGWLGVLLSVNLRHILIHEAKLPFPTGIAAADTILATIKRGKGLGTLLSAISGAGLFTLLRDGFGNLFRGWIPFYLSWNVRGLNFQIGLIPMTLGGGYLIGMRTSIIWLAGCLASNWIFQPALIRYTDLTTESVQLHYVLPMGIGIVVASGLMLLLKIITPRVTPALSSLTNMFIQPNSFHRLRLPILVLVAVALLTGVFHIPLAAAIPGIIGLWIMTVLAGWMAGETNIDPMEILAAVTVVCIQTIVELSPMQAVFLTAVIAVAVGVAADLLFDFKAAAILGTDTRMITRAQLVGVLPAALFAGLSLVALLRQYTPGTPELFSMQAQIVAYLLQTEHWLLFAAGFIVGLFLMLINISGLAFGVGFFIPMFFSIGFALGGIINGWIHRRQSHRDEQCRLIAAGLIGGEGVFGSLLAIAGMLFTL